MACRWCFCAPTPWARTGREPFAEQSGDVGAEVRRWKRFACAAANGWSWRRDVQKLSEDVPDYGPDRWRATSLRGTQLLSRMCCQRRDRRTCGHRRHGVCVLEGSVTQVRTVAAGRHQAGLSRTSVGRSSASSWRSIRPIHQMVQRGGCCCRTRTSWSCVAKSHGE